MYVFISLIKHKNKTEDECLSAWAGRSKVSPTRDSGWRGNERASTMQPPPILSHVVSDSSHRCYLCSDTLVFTCTDDTQERSAVDVKAITPAKRKMLSHLFMLSHRNRPNRTELCPCWSILKTLTRNSYAGNRQTHCKPISPAARNERSQSARIRYQGGE